MTRPSNPELKGKIKKIAAEEITKKGYENINMREIARRASVTPTTIYYYYKNKDDLFDEIKKDAMDIMDSYILSKIIESDKPTKQLETVMNAFMDWSLSNPGLARFVFDKLPNKIDDALYSKSYYKSVEIIEKGKKTGEFGTKESELDVTIGTSSMFGLALLIISGAYHPKYKKRIPDLKKRLIEMFVNQIRKK